ncbi:MAG: HDOD domain-containing protein [Methylobacter sp.]
MQPSLIDWTLNSITTELDSFSPPADMRAKISRIKALPPLPGIACRIMKLASDPLADASKLTELIELDPLLTAQVIRWASSSFYGYRGKITSVKEAIIQVLGFDFVLNLALGLAALASLKSPKEGPIGTKTFWVQSLASTHLMKLITEKMPPDKRPQAQQVFLAAFLHNIGFPLLGDQFPDEFGYLNVLIRANPKLTVFNLEKFAFGVDHTLLGAWLMTTWSMPKPITDIVYHHHNPYYRGENYQLNLLTFLNDCLLGQIDIGDGQHQQCPDEVFTQLHVSVEGCKEILDKLNNTLENIYVMAERLSG